MLIHLAHSPDADDAFMFYALAEKKIPTGEFVFKHVLSDIETLNQLAFQGKYEITALSLHAFAHVMDLYSLLPNGASVGKGYGPVLVAKEKIPVSRVPEILVAIPGKYTTAALVLTLAVGKYRSVILPFDQIMQAVEDGKVQAGLLIHEGQITHQEIGLTKILDLGEWWEKETGLPLPLGVDAFRKDLGDETGKAIAEILEESIRYAMKHEDAALDYAAKFAKELDCEKVRTFVRMYVNERSLRYSPREKRAILLILEESFKRGILPKKPEITFP